MWRMVLISDARIYKSVIPLIKKLLQKFHIESFRIYAGVQNLFTITKYPLYDPEVSSNVLFDRGVDGFWQAQESPHEATMNSRVYNLGVNLTF